MVVSFYNWMINCRENRGLNSIEFSFEQVMKQPLIINILYPTQCNNNEEQINSIQLSQHKIVVVYTSKVIEVKCC